MTTWARALVTGARGFIGQHLVHALIQQGTDVVCLDRTVPQQDALSGLKLRRVTGDIRDPKVVTEALRDANVVFHLAASTAPRSMAEAHAINVQGTCNLAAAAASQPTPPVLLYVSSLAVAGPQPEAVTETDACHPVSLYGQTKRAAEAALGELAGELPMTIVRPPCVFGPGDRNLLSLYRSVCRGWNFYSDPEFRYSFSYVDDLVAALIVAAQRGERLLSESDPQRQGYYYVADPQAVTFPELATLVAQCISRDQVRQVRIPRPLGWTVATVGELWQWAARRRVYFNRDKAREAYGGSWICDPARARKQLQVEPAADLTRRLAETTVAYQDAGWLPQM